MSSSLVGVHDRLHQWITSSMDEKNDMVVNMATLFFDRGVSPEVELLGHSRPFILEAKVQRLSLSKMPTWQKNLTKPMDSRRKFGSDKNGNPNYNWEAVNFFHNFFF